MAGRVPAGGGCGVACVARRELTGWPVGRGRRTGIAGRGLAEGAATGQSPLDAIGPRVGKGDQSPGGGTVVPGSDYAARSVAAQDGPALRPVEDGPGRAELLAG